MCTRSGEKINFNLSPPLLILISLKDERKHFIRKHHEYFYRKYLEGAITVHTTRRGFNALMIFIREKEKNIDAK